MLDNGYQENDINEVFSYLASVNLNSDTLNKDTQSGQKFQLLSSKKKIINKRLLIILLISFVSFIVIISFALLFYFYYFKKKPEEVLNKMVSKINDIRSGEYWGEIKIDVANLPGLSQNNFSNPK